MLILGTAVYVVVVGMFLFATVLPRWRRTGQDGSNRGGHILIAVGGVVIPAIVLVIVFLGTVRAMSAFTGPSTRDALTIEVIGRDWWWEVRYPGHDITTANEVHIPVGQPVLLRLTSGDVIHSFWVPELQGKQDLIPGQTNTLWLEASQPGTYRGQCAEYCGLQHAHMAFSVVADQPDAFVAWLQQQSSPAVPPSDPEAVKGQQAFLGGSCSYCHAVKGTGAAGKVGPDLTHIASRGAIGAGVLNNTPGNLGGWIINPQAFKAGSRMPPSQLDGPSLQAILAYLESLK